MIYTPITWNLPNEIAPPFLRPILAVFGGQGTNDAGANWNKYLRIASIVMLKTSPNCEGLEDYKAYTADIGSDDFNQFQFYCVDSDEHEYEDAEESDWYSDAMLLWAEMPDLSALVAS